MEALETFYHNNTEISIAVVAAIVIALVWNPKSAGKIVVVIAIIAVVGFLVAELINLTDSTMDKKSDAASRTDREFQQSDQ